MERVTLPTPSLEGLSWRERNALKMRNRGGQGKFVPSKKNPLLARILAISSSISAPSSTNASSTADYIPKAEIETRSPQSLEDLNSHENMRPVLPTSDNCENAGETQSLGPTQSHRRRKTPSTNNIDLSDSDDPPSLSQAPKHRRRTAPSARSRNGHRPNIAPPLSSLPTTSGKNTICFTPPTQAVVSPASPVQAEDAARAMATESRRSTRSNKKQFIEPSTEVTATSKRKIRKPQPKQEPKPRAASIDQLPLSGAGSGSEPDEHVPTLFASRSKKPIKSRKLAGAVQKSHHGAYADHDIESRKLRTEQDASKSKSKRSAKHVENVRGSSTIPSKVVQPQSDSSRGVVGVATTSRQGGSRKRKAKVVSESSDEDALIIAMPKRLLAAAPGTSNNQSPEENIAGIALSSIDGQSGTPKPKYSGCGTRRGENEPQTATKATATTHIANLPRKASDPPDADRRCQPDTRKKTKRPSLTAIEDSVDEIADEVNKRTDDIAAVVKRVPLPLASSDIEREKQVRGERPATKRLKGQSSSKQATKGKLLHCPSADGTSGDAMNKKATDHAKDSLRSRPPRQASVTTLVSTSSDHSLTSNSTLIAGSTAQAIPRIRVKRTRDTDSEADSLNL